MFTPVSGIIRVSDEVANYRSSDLKRLCLQKVGEGEWEFQFVRPDEENAPSWYSQHHPTLFQRIINIFWRSIPPPSESVERIILDTSFCRTAPDLSEGYFSQFGNGTGIPLTIMGVKLTILCFAGGFVQKHLLSDEGELALQAGIAEARAIEAQEQRERIEREIESYRDSGGAGPILSVEEDLMLLSEDPISVLKRLHEQIATGEAFERLQVKLFTDGIAHEGIDQGGVRRAFLSLLFKSLSEAPDLGEFVFSREEHGFLPKLVSTAHEMSQETRDMLEAIGFLLGFCVLDRECRIQPLFDPRFFKALVLLTPENIQAQDAKAVYLALNKDHLYYEQMAEAAEEYCKSDPFVPALLAIARGMLSLLKAKWQDVNEMTGSELLKTIEGAFSKELLLERLSVSDTTVEARLRKWIQVAEAEVLRNFVEAVTGAPSIGPGMIDIELLADDDTAPARFHTCFNKMDIKPYSSYEEFVQKLEWAIANAKGFGDT